MILVLLDGRRRAVESGSGRLFRSLLELHPAEKLEISIPAIHPALGMLYGRVLMRAKRHEPLASAHVAWLYGWGRRTITERVLAMVGRRRIAGVWVRSNDVGPTAGAEIAWKLGCPLHVTMFDLPFTYTLHAKEARHLREALPIWAAQAASMDFATPAMRAFVRGEGAAAAQDMVTWSSAGMSPAADPPRITRERISTIAYCGALRFAAEIDSLVKAVAIVNRGRRQPIVVRVYGPAPLKAPSCEYGGNLSERELASALATADCGYSPMSFARESRLLVETSFPAKVGTYLAAGLPVLAHAPAYAANATVIREARAGVAIASTDPADLARAILAFEEDRVGRSQRADAARACARKMYDPSERACYFSSILPAA